MEKTTANGTEVKAPGCTSVHSLRVAYTFLLKGVSSKIKFNQTQSLKERIERCNFTKTFDYVGKDENPPKVHLEKFVQDEVNEDELTDEAVFFHFAGKIVNEEEFLQTITDAKCIPGTFNHLLDVAETNFTSKYTIVSLAAKYEGLFSYRPSIHCDGKSKDLILTTETNLDERYAVLAIKKKMQEIENKKGLCD
jgi:hypothetical protein